MLTGEIDLGQKVMVRAVEIPGCPHLPATVTRVVLSHATEEVAMIELDLERPEMVLYGLTNPWTVHHPEIADQLLGGRVVIL